MDRFPPKIEVTYLKIIMPILGEKISTWEDIISKSNIKISKINIIIIQKIIKKY